MLDGSFVEMPQLTERVCLLCTSTSPDVLSAILRVWPVVKQETRANREAMEAQGLTARPIGRGSHPLETSACTIQKFTPAMKQGKNRVPGIYGHKISPPGQCG